MRRKDIASLGWSLVRNQIFSDPSTKISIRFRRIYTSSIPAFFRAHSQDHGIYVKMFDAFLDLLSSLLFQQFLA